MQITSSKLWRAVILLAALLCLAVPLLFLFRDAAEETVSNQPAKRPNNPSSSRVPPSFRALADEHFRVSFPPQLAREDAEQALRVLGKARADLAQRLGDAAQLEAVPRVEVIFYNTTGDFTSATGQPAWAGGNTRGAIIELQPLLTLRQRGILETTLRHEYAHAVIESLKTAPVPRWLNEGLALHFAGESVNFKPEALLEKLSAAELDQRLEAVSSSEEQKALYGEALRRVRQIRQIEPEQFLWQLVWEKAQ